MTKKKLLIILIITLSIVIVDVLYSVYTNDINFKFVIFSILILLVVVFSIINTESSKDLDLLNSTTVELNKREMVIMDGYGVLNHSQSEIKGKIFLTTQRIVFIPFEKNKIKKYLFLKQEDILKVELKKFFKLFSSGILIQTNDKKIDFSVMYPKDWMRLIM